MLNGSASLAFSKPCLVNLISNDTRLVFSIYCSLSGMYNGNINWLLALQYSAELAGLRVNCPQIQKLVFL